MNEDENDESFIGLVDSLIDRKANEFSLGLFCEVCEILENKKVAIDAKRSSIISFVIFLGMLKPFVYTQLKLGAEEGSIKEFVNKWIVSIIDIVRNEIKKENEDE